MAKTISQINTASDTFQVWVDRTNDLANVVSIEVVTANNETGGALTTGNAYVNGIFSVATLSANTELRGGNVDTSAVLTITSNVAITDTELSINESVFSSINVQTSGTSEQIVDNFDLTTYQAAEYVVSIKDNAANGYQVSKLILLHDTGDAYVTEYGVIYSNGMLGTFSANANTTHSRLTVTPTQSNTQLKISRTLIKV
jgi:hypothetical protein